MPEFKDILKSSLNYKAPTSPVGPNLSTIDPTEYYSQLGPGVRGNLEYLNEARADAQNFWESSANFWVRGIGKAILSIPETAGYIMDIPGWVEQNDDFQNSLSEWARQQKEALDESMPEYSRDTHQNENFNPLSGGWWARNGDSAVESLGYFIPGWALGKAVGAGLKAVGAASKIANAGSLLTATLTSNHAEGMQIAVDAYKNTYSNLIKEGMSEIQAKAIASDTAARVSRLNYAMLATDMFQMKTLFKGFDSMRRGVSFNKSALLNGALEIGKQGLTEAGEELYQGAMQREQERRGMKEAGLLEEDGSNVLSRAFDYMTSDQGLTEGFLGFVGGVGFGGVGVAANYKATARDRALGLEQIKLNKDLQSNLLKKQGKVFDDIAASVEEGNEAKYDNAINSMFRNMAYNSAERGVFHNIEEFVDGIDNITEEDLVKNGWSKEEAQKRKADFKEILNQTERIYKQVQNLAPNKSSALRTKLANLLLSQETSKDGIAKAQEQLRTLFNEYKGPEKSDTFNQLYELQRRKEILRLTKDEDLEGGQKQKDFYNAEYEKVSEQLKKVIADFKEMGVEFDKSYTENLSLELPVDYTLAFEYDQTFKYGEQKEEFNSLSKEKNQKAWEETQARLEKEEQYNTNLAEKITNKTKLTEEEQEHYDKNKNQIDVIAEDLEKIKKDKELAELKAKQDNDAKIKAAKLQKVTDEKYTALAGKLGSAVETTTQGTIIPYGEHKISLQVNDDGTTTYTLKTKKGSTTYDNEEALIAMSNQLQGIEVKEKEGSKDGTGKTNSVPLTEAGIQSLKVGDEIVILTKGETRENFNQNPLFYERTEDGFVFKSLQKKDGTLISTGFPADVQSKIDNRLSDLNVLMLDTDIYDVYLIENVKTEPIASAPEVFKGHITVSVVPDDDVKINPEFSEGVRSVMRILKENTLIEKPESEPNQYDWEYSFTDQRNDDTLTLIEDTTYTVSNPTTLNKPIILFSQKRKDEKGLHYSGRIQHIPTLSYKDLTNPITGKIESILDFNVSAPEGTYKREVWYSLKNKNLEKLYEKLAEHKAAGKYQEVIELYEKAINFVKTEVNKTLAIREAFENGIKVKATQTPGYVLIGDLQPGSTLESNVGAFGMNIPHVLGVTKDTNTIFYKRDADGDHNANELDSLNNTIAEFTGQVNQVFLLSAESSTGYVPLRLFKNKITNLSEAKAKEVSDKILVLAYEYRDGFSNLDTKKKIQSEISKLFLTANSAEKNPHANIILDSSYIAIVFTSEGKLHQHKFWLKDIDAVTGKQVNINSFERVNYEHIIDGKTQGAATQILAGDINTNFQAALSNIFFNIDLNNLNKEGDYSPLVDLEEGEVLSYNDYVLKHLVSHNIDYLKDEKGSPKLINGKKRYFGNSAFRVELKDALKQPSQDETEIINTEDTQKEAVETPKEVVIQQEDINVSLETPIPVEPLAISTQDSIPLRKKLTEEAIDLISSITLTNAQVKAINTAIGVDSKEARIDYILDEYEKIINGGVNGLVEKILKPYRKNLTTQNSVSTLSDTLHQKIQKEKVKQWFAAKLPNINLNFVDGLIDNGIGTSFGQFHRNMVTLSLEAPEGTEYHEAFHGVMRSYLSDKHQARIYSEARIKYGIPSSKEIKNFLAQNEGFESFTKEEIENFVLEEKMADDFKEFMFGYKETKQPNIIQRFFNAIKDFINHILGQPSYIARLQNNIAGGRFNKPVRVSTVKQNAITDRIPNPHFSISDEFKVINTLSGMASGLMLKSIQSWNKKQIEQELFTLITEKVDKADEYSLAWGKVQESLRAVDEYEGLYSKMWKDLARRYDIIEETQEGEYIKAWDKSMLSFNPKNTVSDVVKLEFLNIEKGINPVLGSPMYMDLQEIMPTLFRALADKPTMKAKVEALLELASVVDSEKSYPITNLVDKMRRLDYLKIRFFQAFNKYTFPQMTSTFTEEEDGWGFVNSVSVSEGFIDETIERWRNNFKEENLKERGEKLQIKIGEWRKSVRNLKEADKISEVMTPLYEILGELGVDTDKLAAAFGSYLKNISKAKGNTTIERLNYLLTADEKSNPNSIYAILNAPSSGILTYMAKDLNPYDSDLRGRWRVLSKLIGKFYFEKYDNIVETMDGEKQYVINTPNKLAIFVNEIKSEEGERMMDEFSYLEFSNWLQDWRPNGKVNYNNLDKFEFAWVRGIQAGFNGVGFAQTTDRLKDIEKLAWFLDSFDKRDKTRWWAELPYEADKTHHFIAKVPYYDAKSADFVNTLGFKAFVNTIKQEVWWVENIKSKLAPFIVDGIIDTTLMTEKQKKDLLLDPIVTTTKNGKVILGTGFKFAFMPNLNSEEKITDAVIEREAKEWIKEQTKIQIDELIKHGVFTRENDVLESSIFGKKFLREYNSFEDLIRDFVINSTIVLRESSYFVGGFDQEYKDALDKAKRAVSLGTPNNTQFGNEDYAIIVVKDIELDSLIDKKFLKGINTADGGGWGTFKRFKQIQRLGGQEALKFEHIEALERIEKGTTLPYEDIKGIGPLKPVYTGKIYNSTLGIHTDLFIKYAMFPLFKDWTSNTQLQQFTEWVEAMEEKLGVPIEILPESAVKSGKFNVVSIHDENGNFVAPNITEDSFKIIPNKNWGIQMSTPEHELDYEQKRAVQISKIILGNIVPENMYGDQTGAEIIDELSSLFADNLNEAMQTLLDEITENGIINDEKLSVWIKAQLDARGKSLNEISLLDTENGEFLLPLQNNISQKAILPFIISMFNQVREQTIPGQPYYQMSDAFLRPLADDVQIVKTAEGINWLGNKPRELGYRIEGDKIVVDCVISPWSKMLIGRDINAIHALNPDVLKIIGYRIPYGDKNFSVELNVVGFINKSIGDNISVAKELIAIMGFDFDIDKLYVMTRKFYEDENGIHAYTEGVNGRNNKIIDIMSTIINSPHHRDEVLNSGEFKHKEDLAKEFGKPLGDINLNTSVGQQTLNTLNLVAVALKGMAANFNGLVPYLQRLNLQFSTPLLVEEDGVEVEYREVGKLEGNFKGKNGRLITRATGEDVNASMDLAKKPTINTYGVNLTTMPISNVLTIQGFEDFVPLLLTQPIIELLRQTDEQYDELFSKAPAYFKLTEATLSNFALRLWHQGKKGDYRYLINVLHTLAQEQGEVGLVARIERYKDRSTADDKHVFSNYGINEADFKEFANKEIPTFSSQAEAKVWIKDNIKFVIVQLEALNIYHTLNTKAQAISKVSQALSSDRKSPDSMYSVYAMIEARQDLLDEDDKGVITSPIYSFVDGEQYPGIESVFETDVLKDARAYYELDIKMLELLATPSKFFLYSPQYYDAYKLFKQELGLGYLSREADESMYNQYVSYVLAYINSQNPKYKDLNAGEFLTEEFTDFFKQEAAWAVTKGFDVFANFKVEDSKIQQAYNAEVPFISFNSELVDDTLIDVYSAQLKDAMNLTLENYNLTEEEETRINDLVEELFKYQFITTAFITTKSAASKILPFEFFVQNVNGVPSTLRQYAKMSAEDIVNEEFTRKYVQHNYRNSNLARNVTSILPKELGMKFAGTSINAEGTIIISSNKKIHSKKDSKRFITRTEVFKIEDREFKRYKLYERVGTTDNGSVWIQIDTLGIPYKVLEMNRTTSIIGENKAPDRDILMQEVESIVTFKHLHDNSVVIVEPDIIPDVVPTDNSFTYKDNTVGTDFAFSEEQSNALKTLIDFIGDKTSAITLTGAAGTGKTSIIGYLQKYLGGMYSFAYMAPTHAATAELAFATVKTGNNTLPATLASSLTFNSLKEKWVFTAKIAKRLSLNPVVVVDESSMIDQSDIDHLLEAIKDVGGKLIFLGDEKQISKVVKNTATKAISPAFSQFKQVTLTKIFRQSENSLLNLLAKIREQNDFKPFKVENTKAVKFLDRKEYNDELIKDLKSSPESTVVISYTNAAVQGINTTARRILGREGETVKDDIIVGYLGYASKQIEKGNLANSIAYTITNIDEDGSRRIITAQSSKLAKLIQTGIKNISDSAVFYYYQLSNDDSLTFDSLSAQDYENNNKDISALFKAMHEANEDFKAKKMSYPSYLGFVAGFSQTLASYSVGNDYVYNPTTDKMEKFDAIKHKNIKTSGQGSLLFSKDVDYGHAITIHKSQGATIDNVYFDSASLKSAQNTPIINKDGVQITTEKQSLLYVAMSRSKNKLVVYEGDVEFEMIENNDIYSKLGNKTKSENVVIKSWGELKNATAAIIPTGIIATRIPNTEEHFGNLFSHDPQGKAQGLIKTETIKEAVEKYIDWVINSEDKRAVWIREQLKSGELKGKPIFYYKELGEPSHATALDYLINKYDWNQDNQWSTYADRIQAKDDKMNEEMWNKLSAEEKQEIIRCLK